MGPLDPAACSLSTTEGDCKPYRIANWPSILVYVPLVGGLQMLATAAKALNMSAPLHAVVCYADVCAVCAYADVSTCEMTELSELSRLSCQPAV